MHILLSIRKITLKEDPSKVSALQKLCEVFEPPSSQHPAKHHIKRGLFMLTSYDLCSLLRGGHRGPQQATRALHAAEKRKQAGCTSLLITQTPKQDCRITLTALYEFTAASTHMRPRHRLSTTCPAKPDILGGAKAYHDSASSHQTHSRHGSPHARKQNQGKKQTDKETNLRPNVASRNEIDSYIEIDGQTDGESELASWNFCLSSALTLVVLSPSP